jgi:hypothetical protein
MKELKQMRKKLKKAHVKVMQLVRDGAFREIDGRYMRSVVKLGLAVETENGNWKLTDKGRRALNAQKVK